MLIQGLVNTWDTADVYGNGESEILVGKAIRLHKIPREKYVRLHEGRF